MSRGFELADEEHAELLKTLRAWHVAGEGYRAIGESLGYERISASQQISRVAKESPTGRIGRDLADRIYKRLGIDRSKFLASKGLSHLIDRHPDIAPEPVRSPRRSGARRAKVET